MGTLGERIRVSVAITAMVSTAVVASPTVVAAGAGGVATELVTRTHDGSVPPRGDYPLHVTALDASPDGRFVAFVTRLDGIVPEDTDLYPDAFLRDRETGAVELVSVPSGGGPVDGQIVGQWDVAVSADGRYVAFTSDAALVADDGNGLSDVYVRDRVRDDTVRVSVSQDGSDANHSSLYLDISDDGSRIAFYTNATNLLPESPGRGIFVADWQVGGLRRVSDGDAGELPDRSVYGPALSGDGTVVAFHSGATNLHPDANGQEQVYVRDLPGGPLQLVSRDADGKVLPYGSYGASLDGDGDTVAFYAKHPYAVWVRDRAAGTSEVASVAPTGDPVRALPSNLWAPALTADGRYVAFSVGGSGFWSGTDWSLYAFLRDRQDGTTIRMSVAEGGGLPDDEALVSGVTDSAGVLFLSAASNLVDAPTSGEMRFGFLASQQDVTPPTWPEASTLTATDVGSSFASLEWTAATDDRGVARYRLLRDSTQVAEVEGTTTRHTVTGLEAGRTYTFQVVAVDDGANATPGPSTTVTTTSGDGSAGLVVETTPGGVASLTWDPASSDVAGYRVLRGVDGSVTAVADVGPTTTTFEDSGLAPSTTYSWRVDALDSAGTAHPHTAAVTATTPDLELVGVDWTASRGPGRRLLRGTEATIVLRGEPNRQATATVAFLDWYDGGALRDSPREADTTVPLTEDPGDPGSYRGGFTLRDGVAEITSVTGTLDDGAGNTATATAPQPAAEVTGALQVSIEAPPELVSGRVIADSPIWIGGQVPLDTAGPHVIGPLVASSDYRLRHLDSDGVVVGSLELVTVRPGLEDRLTIASALPSTLRLQLVGEHGGTPAGQVLVTDATTGTPLDAAELDAEGRATLPGLVATTDVQVTYQPTLGAFFTGGSLDTLTLTAGDDHRTLTVPEYGEAALSGTVTFPTGAPMPDAVVTVRSMVGDSLRQVQTTTDAEGRYQLAAMEGSATITVSFAGAEVARRQADVVAGSSRVIDITAHEPVRADVSVEVYTQYPGEPLQGPVTLDWRTAVHLKLSVTSDVERVSGWGFGDGSVALDVPGPGSEVRICADGWEAGLPAACTTATVGSDLTAAATLELRSVAGIAATLTGPDGTPLREGWEAYVRRRTASGGELVREVHGAGDGFEVWLEEAGSYTVDVVADTGAWATFSVTAGNDGVTDAGDVGLTAPGAFAERSGAAFVDGLLQQGGELALRVEAANDGTAVAGAKLAVEVPSGTALVDGSVTLDGAAVTPTISGGRLILPLGDLATGASRVLRLRLLVEEPPSDGAVAARAAVVVDTGEELLGIAVLRRQPVSLYAPDVTPHLTMRVSGHGPPGDVVEILADQEPLGAVLAGADGRWTATITLPDLGPWHPHRLVARLADDLQTRSAVRTVEHDPDHPEATRLVMRQSGGATIGIDPRLGPVRVPYTFAPGHPLQFEVTFASPERVRDPIVVIGRRGVQLQRVDGGARFVGAASVTWEDLGPVRIIHDAALGDGYYDRREPTPGELLRRLPPEIGQPLLDADLGDGTVTTTAVRTEQGPTIGLAGFRPARSERITSSDGPVDVGRLLHQVAETGSPATVGYSNTGVPVGDTSADLEVTFTAEEVEYTPTASDLAYVDQTGVRLWGTSVSTTVSANRITATLTTYIPAEDAEAGLLGAAWFPRATTNFLTAAAGTERSGHVTALLVTDPVKAVRAIELSVEMVLAGNDLVGAFGSMGTVDQINQLRAWANGCVGPAGPGLRARADALRNEYIASEGLKLGLAVASLGLASTGVGAVGSVALLGSAALLGLYLDDQMGAEIQDLYGDVKKAYAAGDCEDDGDGDGDGDGSDDGSGSEPPPVITPATRWADCLSAAETLAELDECGDPPIGPDADPVYILDPSGYVYEAVEDNRLRGVTATVTHADDPSGPWQIWDADWFGQINPHQTDAEGRYGWDVPPGWWRVLYELPGYESAASDTLPVPPPHFDVNVGLRDLSPPSVRSVTVDGDTSGIRIRFDRHMAVGTVTAETIRLTDADGEVVPATVTAVDTGQSPGGADLATTFHLSVDEPLRLGATYKLRISQMVASYADRPMLADVTRTLTIAANAVPVADDDTFTTIEDGELFVAPAGALHGDTDADGHALTARLAVPPRHGKVELAADGSFRYMPEPDFAGTDIFTYVAEDGWATTDPATVSIVVRPVADAPVALGDNYVVEDGVISVGASGVLANDDDADGDPLSALLVAGPRHGTVTFAGDGSFEYVADRAYDGEDSFTYAVWDGQQRSRRTASVRLDVQPFERAVPIDVLPEGCPNPLSSNQRGLVPVAISGTRDLDVATIDPESITLTGVAARRWTLDDVTTAFGPFLGRQSEDCSSDGPDGKTDLVLLFDAAEVLDALGAVQPDEVHVLLLEGAFLDGFGLVGDDVVWIRGRQA